MSNAVDDWSQPEMDGLLSRYSMTQFSEWERSMPNNPSDMSSPAPELLGEEDPEFMTAERRVLLSNGMRVLADREQEIMRLRFFEGLTQREIAEQVGISQMHVSRLIRRSLEDMRQQMADTDVVATPQRRLRAA